jgi:ribonuclease HI
LVAAEAGETTSVEIRTVSKYLRKGMIFYQKKDDKFWGIVAVGARGKQLIEQQRQTLPP